MPYGRFVAVAVRFAEVPESDNTHWTRVLRLSCTTDITCKLHL